MMTRKQRLARSQLRNLVRVHPELADCFYALQDLSKFDTTIKQFPASCQNDLHRREPGMSYVPEGCRKFISCDVNFFNLYRAAYNEEPPAFLAAGGPRKNLAFNPQEVRVGIVVAGGTAPGTNAVIHWLVKRHIHDYGLARENVFGFIGGFRGLSRNGEHNLITLYPEKTESQATEPGCMLGMSRHYEEADVLVNTLEELKIDILYVVGGDGTLEAAYRIYQEVEQRELKIAVCGIPKTIDNDIVWCWQTFGFETAVQTAALAIRSFHANVRTHGRIGLIVLYGGHSGFLAANAASASGVTDIVLIPEESVNHGQLIAYTDRLVARRHDIQEDHALIVVAEGTAWDPSFSSVMKAELGKQGYRQKNLRNLNELPSEDIRVAFSAVLFKLFRQCSKNDRHIPVLSEPRSLISAVPPTAQDIRFCQRLAYNSVDNALAGYTGFMSSHWLTEYVIVPFQLVAGKRKEIPIKGAFWSAVRASTGQPRWS